MRVLHVIPSISPVRGGPSQAVIEMVSALCQTGIEAEILTTNDHGANLLDIKLHQRILYEGAPTWVFPRYSPNLHAIREFAFSKSFTVWLWHHICDYDLVHIHAIFSYPSTVAMAIARIKGVPYIVRPLGQLCNWSLQQSARKKRAYLRLIEQNNLCHSAALHFTSIQEQTEAQALLIDRPSFVLPHGIIIPKPLDNARLLLRQQLHLPPDEPIILFLSRLHPKKGLDYLIPALGQLKLERFTFLLAGSGDAAYEVDVSQLITSAGLQPRVRRLGLVAGDFKQLLLQGADLFVLTSHSENFGVAVLEAIAAGLPVVVTSGVALATVVAEKEIGVVTELDVETIAKALMYCLHDPEASEAMGRRAKEFVYEQYSWETIAQQMKMMYEQILNRQVALLPT
jgi:glycosyltransferase involved in cell wall biosynthesis